MTTLTDIVNRALQIPGTRTTVSDAELATNSTNEAIQANLILDSYRRRLLRMAPWDCALKTANLVYITSAPGTPENQFQNSNLWSPGTPAPPWLYEYQYPVDCLRACWIAPAAQIGFFGGVPVTTMVTGGGASLLAGPPVKFKVQTDTFVPVTSASVAAAGSNYAVNDIITMPVSDPTQAPNGAPVQLRVTSVGAGGSITGVQVVSIIPNKTLGGSYFTQLTNPVVQGSTSGSGTGATFNLTYGSAAPQRVILCNQEFAILSYCQDIVDPDVMDDLFQEAYVKILGAALTLPLTGEKTIANNAIKEANEVIKLARVVDGNEGLTVNDTTPDWIRARGVDFPQMYNGPEIGFDWGSYWPQFG